MTGQKRDLARHNSEARAPAASCWIGQRLRLDSAEIQIDLAARVVKYQEVFLGLIFQERRYFRQISGGDSGVSLECGVAHGNNIPGYKWLVNTTRVKYSNRDSPSSPLARTRTQATS